MENLLFLGVPILRHFRVTESLPCTLGFDSHEIAYSKEVTLESLPLPIVCIPHKILILTPLCKSFSIAKKIISKL